MKRKRKADKEARGVYYAGFTGNRIFGEKALKTSESVLKKLKSLEIVDASDTDLQLPKNYSRPVHPKPNYRASFNVSPEVAKFVFELFVTWIGTKALDNIWDNVKGAFKFGTFQNGEICELQFKSSLDEFTVVIRFQSTHEQRFIILINDIVPKVIRLADDWVLQKGITHKYMIYNIKDDAYSKVPILKDEL